MATVEFSPVAVRELDVYGGIAVLRRTRFAVWRFHRGAAETQRRYRYEVSAHNVSFVRLCLNPEPITEEV
jgi:hypothetical protein